MQINNSIVEPEILKELPNFEIFFSRIGFKRIDGSVFGLLVLAKKPLSSEEIEEVLNLSQSAVSLSLKTLTTFGAIETTGDRDNPGAKARLHYAKEDSLAIVASVFRKREEEIIADFKRMAQRVLDRSEGLEFSVRKRRMQSIITTCEIAESVMNFVITLAHNKTGSEYSAQYENMVKRLPKALDLISSSTLPLAELTMNLKENFTEKFKNNLKGIYEKR
ncbi:MAG: ArsR family transcriptional regulator [Bdellovibrionales bacterium]|nr:ArsR family transcriptional regulator [Bdellovibrionales bacterium]